MPSVISARCEWTWRGWVGSSDPVEHLRAQYAHLLDADSALFFGAQGLPTGPHGAILHAKWSEGRNGDLGGRLCEVPFEQVREVRHRKSCAFGFRHLVAPGRVHSEEAFDSRLCLCFEDATLRAHLLAVGVTFDDLVLGELVQCELILDGGFKPLTLLAWQVLRRYWQPMVMN